MPTNPTPTRSTSEQSLDQWNQALRSSPLWQDWIRTQGFGGGRAVGLSDRQQEALERHLAQNGIQIPSGMHIDHAGNLNQKNRLLRNIGIGAGIGGAALTGFGLAGMGPLAGLGGGAGAAAGGAQATGAGAGGTLASSSIPAASLMGGAPAIASQGASAGLGGLLASSSLPAGALMGGPAAIGSQGASGAMGAAGAGAGALAGNAAGGGGSLLGKVLTGLKDYGPSALAGLGAVRGLTQGKTDAESQLAEIIKMAQGRVQASEPLFQALNSMAMAQLPAYSRGQK